MLHQALWRHGPRRSLLMASSAAFAITVGTVGAGLAQTPPKPGDDDDAAFAIEEIVVTGRRREENIYDAPVAITAFDQSAMAATGIERVDDIGKFTPNVNINRFGVGNPAHAAVFIRGIGLQDHIITTDPGVGVYVDGVYLGRQMGSNLSLANIERVEVLRGPQGTLFGRNTLGGAINIITRKPGEDDGAMVELRGGSRQRAAGRFYGNKKLSDTVAVSLSAGINRRDGVGEFVNLENPEADVGEILQINGRVAARWQPTSTFSLLFAVDGTDAENGQSPYTIEFDDSIPQPDPDNPFDGLFEELGPEDLADDRDDIASTVQELSSTSNSAFGASVTADWDFTPNLNTKIIASYRYSDYTGGLDDDASALRLSEFPESGDAEQVSVELQLNGSFADWDFVSGLYYFHEDGTTESGPWVFSPFNSPNAVEGFGDFGFFDLNQETNSYAVFGNASYNLTSRITVGGGLRFSADSKDADALFPSFPGRAFREADFEAVTADANISYNLTDRSNVYFAFQRGYQTGGFPPRPFGGPQQFVQFDEQTALNYEIGFKGELVPGLSLLATAFWTTYNDLALPFSDPTAGGGFVTITENAGQSRTRGIELEGNYRLGGFGLRGSVGFLDAEITDVDPGTIGIAEGDRPALTPRWTVSVSPSYTHDFASGARLRGQVNYSYRGDMFGQSINRESERLEPRSLVNVNLEYESPGGGWALAFYGNNIFNEVYSVGRLQQNGFVGVVLSNDRSEFGVRLTLNFGDL